MNYPEVATVTRKWKVGKNPSAGLGLQENDELEFVGPGDGLAKSLAKRYRSGSPTVDWGKECKFSNGGVDGKVEGKHIDSGKPFAIIFKPAAGSDKAKHTGTVFFTLAPRRGNRFRGGDGSWTAEEGG